MNALILVGGLGSRLKPITNLIPKPLVPICGIPNIERQIQQLMKVGVKNVVLALGFNKSKIEWFVKYLQIEYKIQIVCSVEETPLGTAGPLKLAESFLKSKNSTDESNNKNNKSFIVLNSDILGDFQLEKMI